MAYQEIERFYNDCIGDNSILCTEYTLPIKMAIGGKI
jgi:hypothetical protein